MGAGADIGQHGQRWPSWLQEKARRRWSLDTYQLHRLHYENEALKGKNASTRTLTDTAIINEMNTRARGGNPADIPHHDIGFSLPQSHSLSISPSLICSTFACPLSYSALHHSVCNTFCKSINIVPGVDLITSVGPNLFSCQYSIPTNSLRHQAITPVPDLPFPLHGTNPGALSTPSLLILCMPIMYALMPVCTKPLESFT